MLKTTIAMIYLFTLALGANAFGATEQRSYWLTVGATVYIQGIESRPEINGLFGEILRFDATNDRYSVKIARQPLAQYRDYLTPEEYFEESTFALKEKNLVSTQHIRIVDKDAGRYECLNPDILTGSVFKVTDMQKIVGLVVSADVAGSEIAFFSYDFETSWTFCNP